MTLICSRCGTNNAKTSKFCRECGKRLMIESVELVVDQHAAPIEPADDAAVSDLLYETIKFYERGRLDIAFAKCREALGLNPNSPSGHSLLGMIYERKAEEQAVKGNREDAQDYLQAAIRQMERVLEANPDSVADRGKLEELRAKLEGHSAIVVRKRPPILDTALSTARRVPLPWAAGAGTFIFVLILYAAIFAGGGKAPAKQSNTQGRSPQTQTQQPQQTRPMTTYSPPAGPVWTYNPQQLQPQPEQQAAQPQAYAQQPQGSYLPPQVTPLHVPQEPVAITPYPVQQPRETATPRQTTRKPEQVKVQPTSGAVARDTDPSPGERARSAYVRGDYANAAAFYEQALLQGESTAENHQSLGMCLYNLGKKSAAVTHFDQAIQLYLSRKAKGIDVESADNGIRTCKLYIDLSKE